MARQPTDGPTRTEDDVPGAPEASTGTAFPMHEHIGRQLKIMFDEVVTQPVPDKLRLLLEELERKTRK